MNPWHTAAKGCWHDTVGGRQGLMSTTHSCLQLLQCNESLVHFEGQSHFGTLLYF